MEVKVHLVKGRGAELTWMTTWTFSLLVSQLKMHFRFEETAPGN